MKLNCIVKLLLLIVISDIVSAQNSCKGGACRVSLDSLDKVKISKKLKSNSSTSQTTKNKEIHEKVAIKLTVK